MQNVYENIRDKLIELKDTVFERNVVSDECLLLFKYMKDEIELREFFGKTHPTSYFCKDLSCVALPHRIESIDDDLVREHYFFGKFKYFICYDLQKTDSSEIEERYYIAAEFDNNFLKGIYLCPIDLIRKPLIMNDKPLDKRVIDIKGRKSYKRVFVE